jgi:prolyl-tRNA synthetase
MEKSTLNLMLKKCAVNVEMYHNPVSICTVVDATVSHLESLNHVVDAKTVKSIVAEIRKNREVSTIVLHADNLKFNPSLTVTGTNCRLFPVYFVQKMIDAIPEFINPESLKNVEPVVVVEPVVDVVKPAKKSNKKA